MSVVQARINEFRKNTEEALRAKQSVSADRRNEARPTKTMLEGWFARVEQAAELAIGAAGHLANHCQQIYKEYLELLTLYNQREEELKASQVYAEELVKVVKQREDGFEAFAQWVALVRSSGTEVPLFSFGEESIDAFAARTARKLLSLMRCREDDVELARLTEARLALKTVVLVTKTSVPGE